MSCSNNLKQLGLALHNYHGNYNTFPPGAYYTGSTLSWNTSILPQIEQSSLYEELDHVGPYLSDANKRVALNRVATFLCPSFGTERSVRFFDTADQLDGKYTHTIHYLGVLGPTGPNPLGGDYPELVVGPHGGFATGGAMRHDAAVRMADILDGTSHTYLLGELSWKGAGTYRNWARGADVAEGCKCIASAKNIEHGIGVLAYTAGLEFNDASFGSMHPGGTHFAYADGSVHFVTESINMGVYKSMASSAEGEVVDAP